ncbi:MAG: hypothetical protein WC043_09880 [Pseudobdellovibrionaceae bacterium]
MTFLKSFLAASALTGALVSQAAPPAPLPEFTDGERLTMAFMQTQGISSYMMLNKARGTVRGIVDGEKVFEVSALFGKTKGDSKDANPYTTPAGQHEIIPTIQQEHPRAALVFDYGTTVRRYVIHRLIDVPHENRPQRLASVTARDNYISNGCVNVEPRDYPMLSRFVEGAQQRWQRPDGVQTTSSVFVVMPEREKDVRRVFHIPDDFSPK